MKILLVANDPREIGGVSNYTRPLAVEFAGMGHDVFFFYSGAWHRKYNWFLKPYLRTDKNEFPFESAELVNSPNWHLNPIDPQADIRNPATERIFRKYVETRKPEIVHFHSRLGLPESLIEIAADMGLPVFNTIHVYGLICPRRVLIDREGKPCSGPSDFRKCADCMETVSAGKVKFLARVENTRPGLLDFLVRIKRKLSLSGPGHMHFRPHRGPVSDRRRSKDRLGLEARFDYAISLMNRHVTMNICVSSDVRRTLIQFGVRHEKLLVQSIGSTIAKRQKWGKPRLHAPLVIGNIGGVGYYKGTHVLLDAVQRLRGRELSLKIYGKYESDYVRRLLETWTDLPVTFFGRYDPGDLADILEAIDVMVLPSICKDTAPQTIFESFSAGIPIVASDIGGFPDFIRDNVNGRLFPPGDGQALADRLADILDHPEKIAAFSRNIPRLKTIAENARELITLYSAGNDRI